MGRIFATPSDATAEPIARFDIPLTVSQCATLLQCHPQTVYSWIAKGVLRAGYVGRHRRVNQSELTRFMGMAAPHDAA